MPLDFEILAEARGEIVAAVFYYENQQFQLGDEITERVREAQRRLIDQPLSFELLGDGPYRQCRTQKFPHGVIYRMAGDIPVIVAFRHLHSRDYWQGR